MCGMVATDNENAGLPGKGASRAESNVNVQSGEWRSTRKLSNLANACARRRTEVGKGISTTKQKLLRSRTKRRVLKQLATRTRIKVSEPRR